MKDLTDRQREILNFIRDFSCYNQYPPTFREIGKEFGIKSTFGVSRHITALVKKGYLRKEKNKSRSLIFIYKVG